MRQGWCWLCVAVALVYTQTITHEFTNYDDTTYITHNPHTTRGLSWEGVQWAFEGNTLGMWHPLTVLAHMLDWTLFGAWAGGHLAVSMGLHALNACLLLLLLRRLTGAGWPSFVVALLFAVHPLNVESVAWASQRKTVLSGLFFLLTLLAWHRYTQRKSWAAYGLALGWYALGLMSKPILYAMPGVLLLLDGWPLRRVKWTARAVAGLVGEKVPFMILALVAIYILLHPWGMQPVPPPEAGFTGERWLRALANSVVYLRKLAWPVDLAVLYPHRPVVPVTELLVSGVVLAVVSVLAWRARGPLLVGWLWFLGLIFAVSGVMPIGPHEQADRYGYLSSIGIFLMVAWTVPARFWARPRAQIAPVVAGAGLVFAAVAWWQVGFWQNSLTLWSRAVALYPPSAVQQLNYGNALSAAGQFEEAARCFALVIQARPDEPQAYMNLASIRNQRGDHEEALRLLQQAVRVDPGYARAHDLLGSYLHDAGRVEEARRHLETAMRLDPQLGSVRINLGVLLAQQGELAQAEQMFLAAAKIDPADPIPQRDLVLVRQQLAKSRQRRRP